MRHFLAYGNSDQASFRDDDVLATFDYLMVPGTIATYYSDATAAFVLESSLNYVIDPRTPLFQGRVSRPRASHETLAEIMGPRVADAVREANRATITIPSTLFDDQAVGNLVRGVVEYQRAYGARAPQIEQRLDRYRQLRARARGTQVTPSAVSDRRPPAFVLAPYFVTDSRTDDWWRVNEAIWQEVSRLPNPDEISIVTAVGNPLILGDALTHVPEVSSTIFFWIAGLEERSASARELISVWESVAQSDRDLVNLYGGFFSVCMSRAGLWGFSNGFGYSESREWPELGATGAAPPRYYVRALHRFFPKIQAEEILTREPAFRCDCSVCSGTRAITRLTYHDLKKHFALARAWELQLVDSTQLTDLSTQFVDAYDRYRALQRDLPQTLLPDVEYLRVWQQVLEQFAS